MIEPATIVGWLLLSALGALPLGYVVRRRRVAKADRALARLEKKDTAEFRRAKAEADRQLRELDKTLGKPEQQLRSRLNELQAEEKRLLKQSEDRQKTIRETHDKRVLAARTDAEKQITALKAEAQRRLAGKDKKAAKEFPAYQRARADGYGDGKKPSEAEVNRRIAEKFGR